jgi:hypothetical protein
MKTTVTLVLLSFALTSQGQFTAGIIGGINSANYGGKLTAQNYYAPYGGLEVNVPLHRSFGLFGKAIYNRLGSKTYGAPNENDNPGSIYTESQQLKIGYLDFSGGLTFSHGRLTLQGGWFHGRITEVKTGRWNYTSYQWRLGDQIGWLRRAHSGLTFGATYRTLSPLSFQVGYLRGLTSVGETGEEMYGLRDQAVSGGIRIELNHKGWKR